MPLPVTDFITGRVYRAVAMYYHDGPSGNHKRKVHAQCLPFGGGNFAATMRPVQTSQGGLQPMFDQCMQGTYSTSWGFQDSSGQVVTTILNTSGFADGDLTRGFGRIALGEYERFSIASPSASISPADLVSSGFTGTLSNVRLMAFANYRYASVQGNIVIADGTVPSYSNSIGLTYDAAHAGETVTIDGSFFSGPGWLFVDGQHHTTFNLVHYYSN
jgi:hypothetical protein